MLPSFYQEYIEKYLTESQRMTLQLLVWLLQSQKQIKIERLAATLPLPIKYESRRRHIQRFLKLNNLSISLLWLPLIERIINQQMKVGKQLIIAFDRTQWGENNVLMIAAIIQKRAFPIYWILLGKEGCSNLAEQQAVISPVLRRFKAYKLVFIGDREFHSVELGQWLQRKKIGFALRQKKDTTFRQNRQKYQALEQVNLIPGMKLFLTEVDFTQRKGFGKFNLAIYWQRKYRGKQEDEAWYLLTNLPDCQTAVKIYGQRFGIEAMFKDCKTGGYNLEGTKAAPDKLSRLILLIALALTSAWLQGQKIRLKGQEAYVCRAKERGRIEKRHSNFWIGLYGTSWIVMFNQCQQWVEQLMSLNVNKKPFYQRGLNAMKLIQQAF